MSDSEFNPDVVIISALVVVIVYMIMYGRRAAVHDTATRYKRRILIKCTSKKDGDHTDDTVITAIEGTIASDLVRLRKMIFPNKSRYFDTVIKIGEPECDHLNDDDKNRVIQACIEQCCAVAHAISTLNGDIYSPVSVVISFDGAVPLMFYLGRALSMHNIQWPAYSVRLVDVQSKEVYQRSIGYTPSDCPIWHVKNKPLYDSSRNVGVLNLSYEDNNDGGTSDIECAIDISRDYIRTEDDIVYVTHMGSVVLGSHVRRVFVQIPACGITAFFVGLGYPKHVLSSTPALGGVYIGRSCYKID